MPRTRCNARNASLPSIWPYGKPSRSRRAMRRYDRKWLGLFAASSGGNRILSPGLEIRSASSLGSRWALIVSDIVVVAFIEAQPGGRSPYGRLPETAPSFVEATQRSEAQPAETSPCPSPRVGALHRHRRAARFHGGPRAHGVRRNLHRAPSTVLATVASRHPEGHWRGAGGRGAPPIPHVSQRGGHGVAVGRQSRKGGGSAPAPRSG